MEGTTIALIFAAYLVVGLLGLIAITSKWTFFGLKLFFKRLSSKSKIGLHFIEDLSGDFGMPHIIDLSKSEHTYGKKQYQISQEQLSGARFFGIPFIIHAVDDTKTSAGIYYAQTNKQGMATGELSVSKPSVTLPPGLLRAIVHTKALTLAIEELFNKHKTQIYILGGICGLLGLSLYLNYEAFVKLPLILEQVNNIALNCGGNPGVSVKAVG